VIRCPFCKLDPFFYVNNGVGMEAVAVDCCDLGVDLYSGNPERRRFPRKILRLRRSYSPRKKARAARLLNQYWSAE
jgi:hypothetical protein